MKNYFNVYYNNVSRPMIAKSTNVVATTFANVAAFINNLRENGLYIDSDGNACESYSDWRTWYPVSSILKVEYVVEGE